VTREKQTLQVKGSAGIVRISGLIQWENEISKVRSRNVTEEKWMQTIALSAESSAVRIISRNVGRLSSEQPETHMEAESKSDLASMQTVCSK
jgi:hypothetical protein